MQFMIRLVTVLIVAAAAVFVPAAAAQAQGYAPSIDVAANGAEIVFAGLTPGDVVEATFTLTDGSSLTVSGVVESDGTVTFDNPGFSEVEVLNASTGVVIGTFDPPAAVAPTPVATATATPAPTATPVPSSGSTSSLGDPPANLAFTGSNAFSRSIIGLGLIALGALMVFVVTRTMEPHSAHVEER